MVMKRILGLFTVLVIALCLVGCTTPTTSNQNQNIPEAKKSALLYSLGDIISTTPNLTQDGGKIYFVHGYDFWTDSYLIGEAGNFAPEGDIEKVSRRQVEKEIPYLILHIEPNPPEPEDFYDAVWRPFIYGYPPE